MQDPVKEIKAVIFDIAAADSPDVQRAAVYKHYAPDAGFHHPLARVDPGILSRESILGIWQWYRILSPKIHIRVENIVYDKPHNILLLDVVQRFHLFFLPLESAESRVLVRLTLREENGAHLIAMQEDFYHPEDIAAIICPPLAPAAAFALRTFGICSNVLARSFQVLGYWRPSKTGLAHENEHEELKVNVNGHQKSRAHENPRGAKNGKKKANQNKEKAPLANDHQTRYAGQKLVGDTGGNQTKYEYGQNTCEAPHGTGEEA